MEKLPTSLYRLGPTTQELEPLRAYYLGTWGAREGDGAESSLPTGLRSPAEGLPEMAAAAHGGEAQRSKGPVCSSLSTLVSRSIPLLGAGSKSWSISSGMAP